MEQLTLPFETPAQRELRVARLTEPDGYYCGNCFQINEFADDCGFFWGWNKKTKESFAVCEKCFRSLGMSTAER